MRLSLKSLREKYEVVRKALEAKAQAMRAEKGDEDWTPAPEDAFLAILEEGCSVEVLYHVCRDCRKGHIHGEDGLVETSPERVALAEKVAKKREIQLDEELVRGEAISPQEAERDIPEELRAKVLALHGHACAHCGCALDLHVHHIVIFSQGGPHAVFNLVPCCPRCHGAIHGKTLEVYRDSLGDLHWRSRADRITKVLAGEIEELAAIPSVSVVTVEAMAPAAPAAPARVVAPVAPAATPGGAWEALVKFGYGKQEARERIGKARIDLRHLGRASTEDELFQSAVCGRPVVLGGAVRSVRAENGAERPTDGRSGGREARPEGGDGIISGA